MSRICELYQLKDKPSSPPANLVTSIVITFWPEESRSQWRATVYSGVSSSGVDFNYYSALPAAYDKNERYGRKLAELLHFIGKHDNATDLIQFTFTAGTEENVMTLTASKRTGEKHSDTWSNVGAAASLMST